jgi:hypothetical protein
MNIHESTSSYEAWLRKRTAVVETDLETKHQRMSEDVFSFMRATFYRWAEIWNEGPRDLRRAPVVFAVGDLHVENFGTWRDADGRLVWGVNDFDEAYLLPYTNDLVRLATSALLAIAQHQLTIDPAAACAVLLSGYTAVLTDGGLPFVLAERHAWLRDAVISDQRDPEKYWKKLTELPVIVDGVPGKVDKLLANALPERRLAFDVVHREAGLGSLGRERWTALAEWRGGLVAREAKAAVPSACAWANRVRRPGSYYPETVTRAVRCPDPSLVLTRNWTVRRLAPDCSRIELKNLGHERNEQMLFEAMGRETANIHLGSGRAVNKVVRHLAKRPAGWLYEAAQLMVARITDDWNAWRGDFDAEPRTQ